MQRIFNKIKRELQKVSSKARPVGWSVSQEIVLLKTAMQVIDDIQREYESSDMCKQKWILVKDRKPSKERMRVWMSFSTPWGGYVKRGIWAYGHFEWDNGRKMKDMPDAWMPLYTPEPLKIVEE